MFVDELTEPHRTRMLAWIEALESGEHMQGKSLLEATYTDGVVRKCCLGVLCRVAQADGLDVNMEVVKAESEQDLARGIDSFLAFGTTFNRGAPPGPVTEWLLGTTHRLNQVQLMNMNDEGDKTFVEIAAHLRERYNLPKETAGV
jgi:hypothetical protein